MQAADDTRRWQERVTQLTTRHKSVDKEEYERVTKLLEETQQQLAAVQASAEQSSQAQISRIAELERRIAEFEAKIQQVLYVLQPL